ncbi:MAG: hypothetical protein KIS68_13740 [Bauldia sp.]|nr:hypothetical protein [Bauldia sp.]
MTITTNEVDEFFAAYGRRSNDALRRPPVEDIDGMMESFGPFFVGASPRGIMGAATDGAFRDALAKGFERYRAIGGTSMEVSGVEVVPIDEFHVMAKVGWRFSYDRPKDGKRGVMQFTNVYFLNRSDGPLRIFAAVTPDEESALRQEGLVS